jgi:predicted SAM-dependent methyltransferase
MPQMEGVVTSDAPPAEVVLAAPALNLNIGCGVDAEGKPLEIPGYVNVDRRFGSEAYPLAYSDESADVIRASHVLEHFPQRDVEKVLADWYRVLKPGGVMKLAVPDFASIVDAYKAKQYGEVIVGLTMGGQIDDNDFHKVIFDEAMLKEMMWKTGLRRVRRWESEITDCASQLAHFSLNLMGYKPASGADKMVKVGAALAAPRFGPTLHFKVLIETLMRSGIPCNIIMGCFWHQQLCEAMEKQLEAGMDYVITFDYDSIFGIEEVQELYRLLDANPEADAVCALQSKRGGYEVLFGFDTPTVVKPEHFQGLMTQVLTGHFGCTMFRASALRDLPRPWMTPVPGKDGRWYDGSGHVDADINFWHRWRDAGKKLFLANRVPIGHQQEVITWPDRDMRPIHQKLQEYSEGGKPAGVWS